MPGSPKWSPSLRFPHQKPVDASPSPHMHYMPHPSHVVDLSNKWPTTETFYLKYHCYIAHILNELLVVCQDAAETARLCNGFTYAFLR